MCILVSNFIWRGIEGIIFMENGWIFVFNFSNIKVVIFEKLIWNEEDWKCNVC